MMVYMSSACFPCNTAPSSAIRTLPYWYRGGYELWNRGSEHRWVIYVCREGFVITIWSRIPTGPHTVQQRMYAVHCYSPNTVFLSRSIQSFISGKYEHPGNQRTGNRTKCTSRKSTALSPHPRTDTLNPASGGVMSVCPIFCDLRCWLITAALQAWDVDCGRLQHDMIRYISSYFAPKCNNIDGLTTGHFLMWDLGHLYSISTDFATKCNNIDELTTLNLLMWELEPI